MKKKSTKQLIGNSVSVLVFLAGAFVGVSLLVISVWADLEAAIFDSSIRGEKSIRTMNCPIMITTSEVGEVKASFTNNLERPIKPTLRVHISDGFVTYMREENNQFELAPEETKNLSWTVTPEDAAFGQFILVKIYRFQVHPLPSYQSTCGIFVLDMEGVTGAQLTWAGMAVSLVGMFSGAGAFSLTNKPLRNTRKSMANAMLVFGTILLIGFSLSYFLGSWLLGVVSLVALVLILIGCLAQLLK